MKKVLMIIVLVKCSFTLVACNEKEVIIEAGPYDEMLYVQMEIENYGTVKLELYPNAAPRTVNQFVELVQGGLYDGTTFHRIMDGFMIQGGDASAKENFETAAPYIKGEFSKNGFENPIKMKRGVIAMARSEDYDSARSQFFILLEDTPQINGNYASFGKVVEGMDVIDKVNKETKKEDKNGTVLKENQPVIKSMVLLYE